MTGDDEATREATRLCCVLLQRATLAAPQKPLAWLAVAESSCELVRQVIATSSRRIILSSSHRHTLIIARSRDLHAPAQAKAWRGDKTALLSLLQSSGENGFAAIVHAAEAHVDTSRLCRGSSGLLKLLMEARLKQVLSRPPPARRFASSPLAARQARQLHAAGKGLFCGTDEDAFIEIIGMSDRAGAHALRYEYASRYGHTLASAVLDEMSGELEELLLMLLDPPTTDEIVDVAAAQALLSSPLPFEH